MSQENVEIVRRTFLAAGSGDLVVAQRSFDQSIEWDMSGVAGWPEQDVYRGPEVEGFLRAWAASWGGTWHFDVEDVRDAGGQRVFAAIHERGTGVDSGASVDQRRFFSVTLQEGRIVRVETFSDRAEALRAAGLGE